jgi:hypothetical protein
MSLTIKNGNFVDEKGNVVPVEIGNREQIKVLTQLQKKVEFWGKGVILEEAIGCLLSDPDCGDYKFLKGKCKCGKIMESEAIYFPNTTRLDGEDIFCTNDKCSTYYTIVYRTDIEQFKAIDQELLENNSTTI